MGGACSSSGAVRAADIDLATHDGATPLTIADDKEVEQGAVDAHARRRMAAESALLDSCVWKIINHKGHLEDVRRFPFRSWSMHRDLGKYGCSVAVRLLLVVQQEGIIALVICFLLCVPNLVDNLRRSDLRHGCRFDAAAARDACGRAPSAALRAPDAMPEQPFYLWTATGACEEYRNTSLVLQPTFTHDYPFARLGSAAFCVRAYEEQAYALWSGALVVLVLTAFLLHLRRLQTRIVRDHDRRLWTTSDYAVLIEGLQSDERPKEQEDSLRSDLRALGIGDSAISHIEIGCGCKGEFVLLTSIAQLRVQAQELSARLAQPGRAEKHLARDRAALEATRLRLSAERQRLGAVRDEQHVTTGQAFIVFQYEEQRNQFVRRFDPDYAEGATLLGRLAAHMPGSGRLQARMAATARPDVGGAEEGDDEEEGADAPIRRQRTRARPRRLAASTARRALSFRGVVERFDQVLKGRVEEFADLHAADPDRELLVTVAPEPTDVLWENLEIDGDERAQRTLRTYLATGLLVCLSAGCCFGLTALKANGPEWLGFGRDNSWTAWSFSLGLSGATGLAIIGANYAIKLYVYAATEHERHISRTLHERSLFTKLSLAYIANTVALPALVGSVPFGPSQGWYEVGGLVDQAQVVLITGTLIKELLKLTQPYTWYMRHVRGHFAHSQLRLNALWAPPPMMIGELCAEIVKSMGLCLFYAPLQPLMYLYTALALLLSFAGDKCVGLKPNPIRPSPHTPHTNPFLCDDAYARASGAIQAGTRGM